MKNDLRFNVYEVCKTLSVQQLKSLGFFNLNNKTLASKYDICLEMISAGIIYNDATASEYLGYSNYNSFLRFRHRFTERIKSYIFLIDAHKVEKNTDEKVQKELWRELALAQILLKSDNGSNGKAILSRTYELAKEYELVEIMICSLSSIKQLFAFITPNKTLYEYYKKEDALLRKQYQKLALSREYYDEVSHLTVFSDLRAGVDLPALCQRYYADLKALFEPNDFVAFRSNAYQIATFGHRQAGELEEALLISFEALEFLSTRSKFQAVQKYKILKDVLAVYLQMRAFDKALSTLSEIESMGLSYNFNYFSLQGLKYQVYAVQGRYDDLYQLTHFITSRRELKSFALRYEQWKIKEAFAYFLVSVGKIDAEVLKHFPPRNFRIKKFVNDIIIHSKDKRGANIAIHVVQLLFYLKDKKYSLVLDRLDALNQYTYRYLRNDETLRSNCFIKMLLKLPEADYNPIRTKRYVSKYWKKLLENPLEVTLHSSDVEVIPYEQLWEIVIEIISTVK